MDQLHHALAVPYLAEIVAFLIMVVCVVPLCRYLKLSPIIGFLALGALIGPFSLAWVDDVASVQHIAELGVIFLLFTIGLELSFERLANFAREIFGLGSLHFLFCASVISLCAALWGNSLEASILIGLCLALSSTAVVMQLLTERGEIASAHGRSVFSVLLLQDLMVVPILILLSILGTEGGDSVAEVVIIATGKALIAIVGIIVLGRYGLRYLFRIAVRTRAAEVFMAASLLAILVTASITGVAGLSMALGAFLAGLLLAETEFKHQIETDIEPFKGLFLGLFFASVGMNIDFALAFERGYWVVLSVIGLILLKTGSGFIAGILLRMPWLNALRTAILLAEAGEFAFLVIGQASLTYELIDIAVGQFMVVVAGCSMALTPVLAFISGRLGARFSTAHTASERMEIHHENEHDHVIIAGYGRTGRAVANILNQQSIPYIALDKNVSNAPNSPGAPLYHGDASNIALLQRAGVARARALLLTMDDAHASLHAVTNIRRAWPNLTLIVRAKNAEHSDALLAAGADRVVPELLESSLQLAGHVLRACHYSREEADACIELVRRHNYQEITEDRS